MASEWRMKISLRVKKYLNEIELLVFVDDRVWRLFPREANVDAETVFRSRAFVAGLHDAGAGAGDDHVTGFGDHFGELDGLLVFLLGRLCSGGAEDGDFAFVA